MNSIFKRSKLDEMQEIKQLKIEHYGYWVLYGGLVVSIVVQAAQDAPLAQYLPEGIRADALVDEKVGPLVAPHREQAQ